MCTHITITVSPDVVITVKQLPPTEEERKQITNDLAAELARALDRAMPYHVRKPLSQQRLAGSP